MRKLASLLLLAAIALPASAATRVRVEQLEQALAATHGKPDAIVANELFDMELTERLSTVRLERWEARFPGQMARQALVALADTSVFLDPPATEIPAIARPNPDAQSKIVSLAALYVAHTVPKLPSFFATQRTTRFHDGFKPPGNIDPVANANSRLHFVESSSTTVLYRSGREVVDEEGTKDDRDAPSANGLNAWGVFGPLLGAVMTDALHGKVIWSHWEQGASGPMAVFRYAVPEEKSHYVVTFCCVASDRGNFKRIPSPLFEKVAGYHGEIAVDPSTGAILRLALQADLQPAYPIVRADVMVEYGPVKIGGETYLCPAKSVSITQSAVAAVNAPWIDTGTASGPKTTALNDVVFNNYHLSRGEMRILSGNSAEPDGNSPASPPAGTNPSTPSPPPADR
ncbi:MAG: hypothetical protein ABSE99_07175 [Terracidiphilus sp.]|jgi:hypothetical protein